MTFATHLPRQGVGFALAPAVTFQMAPAPTGGFNLWSQPNAFYYGGKSYIGVVRGTDGDERILVYDHATGVTGGYLLHDNFNVDEHSPPALLRRDSDGKILAFYSQHGGSTMNLKVLDPATPTGWAATAVTSLDAQLGGSAYTYPQVHQLLAETSDPIYLGFRDEPTPGTDSRWCISASTNDGASWPVKTILYRVAGHRSYLTSWSDGQARIHFAATASVDSTGGGVGYLGHFFYEGGAYYKSDGTAIGHGPPFAFADLTPIWTAGDLVFAESIHLDGSGHPIIAAMSLDGSGINHYWYMRWTGSAWQTTEVVANAGTGFAYNPGGGKTGYGCTLDDGDLNVMYAIEPVAGRPEVYKYTTADGGLTFSRRYITRFSGFAVQARPQPIRGRAPELKAYWYGGTFTNYNNFNVGTLGTST